MKRQLTGFVLIAAATISFAQPQRMKVSFGGNESGTTVYELKKDGSWTAQVDVSVAGQKIAMKFSGSIEKDKVTKYKLDTSANGQKASVTVENGKAKVVANGKTVDQDVKGLPAPAMGNFLPQITATVLSAYDRKKGGTQKLDVLLLDQVTIMKTELSYKSPFKFGTMVLDEFMFTLAGINIRLIQDPKSGFVVGMDVPTQSYQQVAIGYEGIFVDPTTQDKSLSQPEFKAKTETAISTKMRDGVELVSDLARPDVDGKFPTILVRTPYGRKPQMIGAKAEWWAKRGYVLVVQDCRGREDSGGEWDPFVNEKNDGYDTIDWITKQPWSDGKVGMIGGSYSGMVQWQAAVMNHPALKCIVPQVSPPDAFFNLPYDHGMFFLYGNVWWADLVREKKTHLERAADKAKDWSKMAILPLTEIDNALFGVNIPFYDEWLKRDDASKWGGWNYQEQMSKLDIPALHISGWWDGDGIGTKTNWAIMAKAGKTNQWLIYGPWVHAFNTTSKLGEIDYGPDAIIDLDSVYLRWFDTWLKGKDVKLVEKTPKVRAFVTGINEWRSYDAWPDSRSTEKVLYFSSTGPANGDTSLGRLIDSKPGNEEPDRYVYNPADTTVPEEFKKADDPEAISVTIDIPPYDESTLLYKSEPLKEPMEIGGPLAIDLYFSSSAVDCDFIAAVVDIDDKGVIRPIGMSGKIRARFLSGWSTPSALEAGKVYQATIEPWDTAHHFKKGHRIAVILSSGSWPMFARNHGTMDPIASATRLVAQSQTIYHDSERPSALRFRLLPKKN